MKVPKKNIRILEKGLLSALIDPLDSDQRKRYVKRWVYGEPVLPNKATKRDKSIISQLKEFLFTNPPEKSGSTKR